MKSEYNCSSTSDDVNDRIVVCLLLSLWLSLKVVRDMDIARSQIEGLFHVLLTFFAFEWFKETKIAFNSSSCCGRHRFLVIYIVSFWATCVGNCYSSSVFAYLAFGSKLVEKTVNEACRSKTHLCICFYHKVVASTKRNQSLYGKSHRWVWIWPIEAFETSHFHFISTRVVIIVF